MESRTSADNGKEPAAEPLLESNSVSQNNARGSKEQSSSSAASRPSQHRANNEVVVHGLELTHQFKKARREIEITRRKQPLKHRLAVLKSGKTVLSAATFRKDDEIIFDLTEDAPATNVAPHNRHSSVNSGGAGERPSSSILSKTKSVLGKTSKRVLRSSTISSDVSTKEKLARHKLTVKAFRRTVWENATPVPVEQQQGVGMTPICEC